MIQLGLIGICAGAAAALLFASVTSGALLSIPLFYLAPLPIMIAGFGWSHWAALIAGLAAALAVGATFSGLFFLAFLTGVGAPAWWLTYLAMLARPLLTKSEGNGATPNVEPANSQSALEWYPPGRLVLWAAALAALVVTAAMLNIGLDAESFRTGLRRALATMLQIETAPVSDQPLSPPGTSNAQHLLDFLVEVIPPAAAVLATLTNVINLWLAARIVKFSGHLSRPWPQISAMNFPLSASLTLTIGLALSFLGGFLGIAAGVFSASLLIAFAVLGFAVTHEITRGIRSRSFLLGGVYASVIVFGWPMLALSLLGLTEGAVGLRARIARRRSSPPLT